MKIDVSKIEGYAEMSAEDKLKALEEFDFEIPKPATDTDEVIKLKNALSNANSQAAEYKRALREKQSEQERAEAERAEREAARDAEIKELRRDKTVSKRLASCLSLGYDTESAAQMAEATANLTDDEADTLFNSQKTFLEAKTKELEAAALNKQPTLTPGAPPTAAEAEKAAQNKMRSYFGLPPLK